MSAVTKEAILAAAREHVKTDPTEARAEEIAEAINTLLQATERHTPSLAFDDEPAGFFAALDALAEKEPGA